MTSTDEGRCYQHSLDPTIVAEREQARRAGGIAATRVLVLSEQEAPRRLTTPREVATALGKVVVGVLTGRLSPNVASVAIYGLSSMTKCYEIDVRGELEALRRQVEGRSA